MNFAAAGRALSPSRLVQALMRRFDGESGSRQRARAALSREVLTFEAIEPRILLSADLGFDLAHAAIDRDRDEQIFYVDIDGAEDVDYRGPVLVEDFDVASFVLPDELAGQEADVLHAMLDTLDDARFGVDVRFTFERPTSGDFSTIYLGGDGSAFARWGSFRGLAQGVDAGNRDANDIALVFSEQVWSDGLDASMFGQRLGGVIAHEAGHLLGFGHGAGHEADASNPLAAVAFDPKVHVAIGVDARTDAKDGFVTIDGKEYKVHDRLVAALQDTYEAFYNAGTVAGDGFPDVLMGQFAIHPIDHATWLTRVLDMAWKAQTDPSFSEQEKLQSLAWSYGFLTHSAGDHFAHTLVNSFAEGVAPGFFAAAVSLPGDQRDLGNMLRHFMTEAYIADSLPGFDGNRTDRTELTAGSGDFTDDTTPAIAYDAPARFIYETFLRAFPDDPTHVVDMKWEKGTLVADAATNTFTRSDIGLLGQVGLGGFEYDGFKVGQKITVTGFAEGSANNGTFYVTAVTPTQLTVSGPLADETASGDEKIFVPVAKTEPFAIVASAADNSFTRSDPGGSFVADGFFVGMRFDALGLSANYKTYIVKTVTATKITVVGEVSTGAGTVSEIVNESAASVQLVGMGRRGPALDGIFKLRDALFEKAVEKGPRGDANELATLAATAVQKLVDGVTIDQALKDDLFRAYLYNWVEEINEGVRHWGEFGLAFTKAFFDAGSRRELQQIIGEETGFADSADKNSIRSKAEDGVGVLDVLIHELEDPDGNGSTFDSFINRHLLPMAGLPAELGLLRAALQGFGNELDALLQPLDVALNPIKVVVNDAKNYVSDFLKKQIEKRTGLSFGVFDYLKQLGNKMDLASIKLPGADAVPVFKPGDHERLDALLGLPANHHTGPISQSIIDTLDHRFTFYAGAQDFLAPTATMDKTAFAAYANAVTLTKMIYLMEEDPLAGAGPLADAGAENQLSELFGDLIGNAGYDFGLMNLNGAHGGNVLTATLPGVADGKIWMTSIDADQIWRQDNYTVDNALFRISQTGDPTSLVEYEASGLTPGDTYKIFVSWQHNVTQKLDNLSNSDFPDQFISPAQNAQYVVRSNNGTATETFFEDQRNFANDIDDGGLGFEQLGADATKTFTVGADGKLKVTLSNVTGSGIQNVVAGPVLFLRTADLSVFRVENKRDPQTLAPVAVPNRTYNETVPGVWIDLKYEGGGGNDPLWESRLLRPAFRALFADWQNHGLDFPDLGDAASMDPNEAGGPVSTNVLASHATAFGPAVEDNQLEVPIPQALETAILDGLLGLVDFATTIEGTAPLQVKIPGIDKSLAELTDLSGAVQDHVRQPIVDYFAIDATPTFSELFAIIDPSLGTWNAGDGSAFEFDLDLRALFALENVPLSLSDGEGGLGLEIDGTLDVGGSAAFVDALTGLLPRFAFGVELDDSLDLADRFYIRAESLVLAAHANAENLDFDARLAFLSVGVKDGSIALDAQVAFDLRVLDTDDDKKITLGEIADNIGNLDPQASGTLAGTLPITASLAGLTVPADAVVTFGATDVFDLQSYFFDFSGLGTDALNFGNIDAAGIVSLIGRLADELDNLRDSGFFDQVSIPLVDGGIDAVLDFATVLQRELLFDSGANKAKDGADTLAFDLNAALAAAGLDRVIVAQGLSGTQIRLDLLDPGVSGFKVSKGAGDGGGYDDLGFAAGSTTAALSHTANAPDNGQITGDAKIKITLQRNGADAEVFEFTLAQADTTANTSAGDDEVKLVRADNSATFDTVQGMVFRLSTILGAGSTIAYDPATDALTFNLGALLPKLNFDRDFDLDFDLELGSLVGIQSSTKINVAATVGFDEDFTFGVYLGDFVPGALSNLSDTPGSATPLDALNDGSGVDIKDDPAFTAPDAVVTEVKPLTAPAHFQVVIDGVTHDLLIDALGGSPGDDVNVTAEAFSQTETAIAVNPVNPLNIVIGGNNADPAVSPDSVWVSIDGGEHWERKPIPIPAGGDGNSSGDPSLAFSRDGKVLVYSHMAQKSNGSDDEIVVAVSFDGGVTWKPGDVRVVSNPNSAFALDDDGDGIDDTNDKNWIAVGPDPDNANQDLFIITWQRSNVIFSSVSNDGLTWTDPVMVGGLRAGSSTASPSGSSIDAIPSFGPDGKIFVAWEEFATNGVSRILFDVSLDGGLSWGNGRDVDVFFKTAESALDDGDRAVLGTIVDAMKANPQLIASISGFTDTAGTSAANQTLSDDRATAVFNFLTSQGIAANRLTKLGFGEQHLAKQTADNVDELLNRRVEVRLDQVIYTGNVNVFQDAFGGGLGLDATDETTSPAGVGEYEIPAQPDRGIWMGLSMDVDRSGGLHDGRIYLSFVDQGDLDADADAGTAVDHHDTDVFLIASDDFGLTWTALNGSPDEVTGNLAWQALNIGVSLVRVSDTDDSFASQFFSWLDVDDETGAVAVSWYDARNDMVAGSGTDQDNVVNTDVQYFAAVSADFGFSWGRNILVSDGASNTTPGFGGNGTAANGYGDYSALAMLGGTVFMAWADNSNSATNAADVRPAAPSTAKPTEIYFDRIDLVNRTVADVVADINAAIDLDAGLDGRIEAFADGNRLGLRATDSTLKDFSFATSQGDPANKQLGFNTAQSSGGPLVGDPLTRFDLQGGDAHFTLTVAGTDYQVTVTKAAAAPNTLDNLVTVVNAALLAALPAGLDNKIVADKSGTSLVLRIADASVSEVGFGAAIDDPAVLELGLTNDAVITLPKIRAVKDLGFNVGRLPQDATLTFALDGGAAATVTLFADDTASNTTILSLVNDLNKALTTPTLKTGTLSGFAFASDVSFGVRLNGSASTTTVTVTGLADNQTLADLVADINDALETAGIGASVKAKSSGTNADPGNARVKFEAASGVTQLQITAAAGNALKLPTSASATSFAGKIVASSSGSRLVLSAADGSGVSAFTVGADAGGAALGLAAGPASSDNVDFEIRLSNPAQGREVIRVTLNAPADLAQLKAQIEAAAPEVEVLINDTKTGLKLHDKTFVVGGTNARTFTISPVNGSAAATGLGIAGVDSTDLDERDGFIDGGPIAGVKLTDRFFLQDAKLEATLTVASVGPVKADANFGFVGIGLKGDATLTATLSVGLADPSDTTAGNDGPGDDGKVSLSEIIKALGDDPLKLLDTPRLTGEGSTDLTVSVTGLPFITLPAAPNDPKVSIDVLNLGDVFDEYPDTVDLSGANATLAADGKSLTLDGDFRDRIAKGALVKAGSGDTAVSTYATEVTFASGVTTVKIVADDTLTTLSGLTIGTPILPAIDFKFENLDDLLSFDNVNFSFASIIDALIMVRDLLSQIEGAPGLLNAPIPLVDVSVNDLLDFADDFSDALEAAQANPAGSLQLLDQKISEAFGVPVDPVNDADPTNDSAPDLLYFTLDERGTATRDDDIVKIQLNLAAGFNRTLGISMPGLNLPAPLSSVVDFGGAATLGAQGSASFALDIGIGLNDPTQLWLYGSSGLHADLELSGADMAFKAALGPLSLSIIDGEASIAGSVDVAFADALFTNGNPRQVNLQNLGELFAGLDVSFDAPVDVTLPVFFPTESHGIGSITLKGDLKNLGNPDPLFVKTVVGDAGLPPQNQPPNSDTSDDKIVLDVSQVMSGLADGLANLSLLDQILFIVDGVDAVLGGVQGVMEGDMFGFTLPLVGDKLGGAADVVGDFRSGFLNDFREQVEKLANPDENGIKDILFQLLGPSGLDLLIAVDAQGDALKSGGKFVDGALGDIRSYNNLADVSQLADAEIWWKVKIGQNLVDTGGDIGFDIGIPGLNLQTEGEISLNIDWELDLGFGLSGKDGFFLFIADDDELLLTATVDVDAGLKGTLGFLEFTAENTQIDGKDTHLTAAFSIDIGNGSDPGDQRLGLSELGRMSFDVGFQADASVALAMTLGIAGDDGGFPQILADFFLDWGISGPNNSPISLFDKNDSFNFGTAIQDGLKVVEFRDVQLDAGSYISNVVGPLVKKIQDITEPVQPIIDIVTTPLPVLSDLGLEITLLDIAEMSGAVNPAFISALETILDVVTVLNSIDIPADGSLLIPLGDFTIYENTPEFASLLGIGGSFGSFDLGSASFDIDKFNEKVFGQGGVLADLLGQELADSLVGEVVGIAGEVLSGLAEGTGPGGGAKAFKFDLLEDPSQIFGLLMGKEATLVSFDMPKFDFDAEFSAFFSIFGPLGVSINLEAAVTIDFAFGYDTKGFRDFAASDFRNPLLLANGLYVNDDPTPSDPSDGEDPPELTFDGGLWAAAELNLGIARGGVGGGIFIGVDFNLFDNDGDGKIRLDELFTNFSNQLKAPDEAARLLAPLAIFDVHGKITAELFAFLKIDFGFFELDKKFNITPPVVLYEGPANFFRPPVLASELDNGDLILNIGQFAAQRKLGDVSDYAEHIVVKSVGANLVKVWAPGLEDAGSEAEGQTYRVTGRIIAIGGEGDDIIDLSGVDASVRYEIEGGVGVDTLTGGAGGGVIRGGQGNDILTGGAGADLIFGNEGDDTVDAKGGNDIVLGDDGEVTEGLAAMTVRHGFVRALVNATDGADTLRGGGDDDLVLGSGAADRLLDGGAGNDIVVGDGALITYNSPAAVSAIIGAGFSDLLIVGGDGDDWLYGGKGNDLMHGDNADGSGSGNDVMFGEEGTDTMFGDAGADVIFGDFGAFKGGDLAKPVALTGGEADVIQGGLGNDRIVGGGGSDLIHGDNGSETVGDDDHIWGGVGMDVLYGDGGNDTIYGDSDPDKLYGGDGKDHLEGGHGNDMAWGGKGADLLVAGYGSDVLDGETDGDTYRITARGGRITELTTAYDSGGTAGTDQLVVIGTSEADTVLLRGMADFYFPTLDKLVGKDNADPSKVVEGLTDTIFNSEDPDKLRAVLQMLEDAYGPHAIPVGLVDDIIGIYVDAVKTGVLNAVTIHGGSTAVQKLIFDDKGDADASNDTGILTTDSGLFPGKLEEIRKSIVKAYAGSTVPPTLLDAIGTAWDNVGNAVKKDIEDAITDAYVDEVTALNVSEATDTGFVALINDGGSNVERFNYRNIDGITVNTLSGDDYVVLDDVLAPTTINLGLGDDRVQVGQVFRSERVKDPGDELITGITAEDVYTTLAITRGWLSNGVSEATTVNGGDGADQFTVFHNIAVLNLNGGDGDDVFTVRAFALRGSSDSERARTDMKGDGGADTILYVVNAPVGIDGGDGFDTVRIVGTEFADDFVVTDEGIFGAGLNVSYVNIEKIVADGAEGDDRFFVQSTGVEVVTEIDGGLGSDTFFVGGNPSNAPIAVVSNDFRGHSGIILHSIEAGSDPNWLGVPIEGVSANVGDNEESFVIVTESEGFSRVMEGLSPDVVGLMAGASYDYYGIRLTRAPVGTVRIKVVPAGMSPEDEAKGFKDLQFYDASYDPTSALGASLGFDSLTGAAIGPELEFNASNWWQTQYVRFSAAGDTASEGRRFVFINHSLKDTDASDPNYQGAKMLSVKVLMEDDDRDGVIVTSTGRSNTVLEDGATVAGFVDYLDVVLAKAPTADVTVTMDVLNDQVVLSGSTLAFPGGKPTLTFTSANWNVAQRITLTAPNDSVVEGFHTDYISFKVSSDDVDQVLSTPGFIAVDGDFDLLDLQPEIPDAKPTSYVLLPHKPIAGSVIVKVDGVQLPDGTIDADLSTPDVIDIDPANPLSGPKRFEVTGNTIVFLTASGVSELRTGFVTVKYSYKEVGYRDSFVKDAVVDIYDEDTQMVIVQPVDDGRVDVIEGDATHGMIDKYTLRLSQAPASGQVVKIKVDAVETRSTYGRTARFLEQVTVNGASQVVLSFDGSNWFTPQDVVVRAIDDLVRDGNDTQVFAPDLQTVNKIRGPLIIEGAAGAGSLTLPAPLMLPHERNILPPHGLVQSFVAGSGAGAIETMVVLKSDLLAVLAELHEDDESVSLSDLQDLKDKTLELSSGPGTGVVLDPARPRDLFDRFWQILALVAGTGADADKVTLTLLNPSIVDPAALAGIAQPPGVQIQPTADTKYAITSLSANFFAKESEQVDYLFVYDNQSVANESGALTSADGVVRGFSAQDGTLEVEAAALQAVARLNGGIGDIQTLVNQRIEISVGPGQGRSWRIATITATGDVRTLTLADPLGSGADPTDRSEFRISGGDSRGRIVGFGMGPSILFNGRPQPGGISYGDIEVAELHLGRGDDDVRVDYATNAEDHTTPRSSDFYTLTILDTGAGDDDVRIFLEDGDDGAFSLNLGAGDDVADAAADGKVSTLQMVIFGWDGVDHITGGAGDDMLFGDRGRVDYVKTVFTDTDNDKVPDTNVDQIVTRLGHSVPANPVNPKVTGSTLMTLEDANANFSTEYGGLVGLSVQAISPEGRVQFRTIVANDEHTITIDRPWDSIPVTVLQNPNKPYNYRISNFPEDQTDGQFRGPRVAWSVDDEIGSGDFIHGGAGRDLIIGGAGDDEVDAGAGDDWVAGDDARFDFVPIAGLDGPTRLLQISDPGIVGDDTIVGGLGNDVLFGGFGNDDVDGSAGNDIVIGDAVQIGYDEAGLIASVATVYRGDTRNGADILRGGAGEDVLIGGGKSDRIDGGSQDDLIFGDDVSLQWDAGSANAVAPRYRTAAGALYGDDGQPLVGSTAQPRPGGNPAWADWAITLDRSLDATHFGDDYIAGGADDDTIFGQRGNDTIQGDGSIDLVANGTPYDASASRASGVLIVRASKEDASDGDDYIEGNAGADLIFGNLGQDDIVGGSSTAFLFSLPELAQRDDGADLIFGGAGTEVLRNEAGNVVDEGDASHSRDSDAIVGDNGNIYRVVAGGQFATFNYDNYGGERIVVRAVGLADYTPGAPNTTSGAGDIGAGDELHGESGDDFVYGMTGSDVLFGEGGDDDLIGGWGHDWISGGTGSDGVIGDDGRVLTSRNGSTEPLNRLTTAVTTNLAISTPGNVQSATINVAGELKKAVDLQPFSRAGDPLFDAEQADDIVYGGLGDDFLHGGWGDDAMSGAEAQQAFYDAPVNAGDVLAYNEATGEFDLYDEYHPMTLIAGFLLNFELEGPLASGTTVRTDGNDRIFGDHGNDWLVGGTGRDNLYGGWGDDLINADDDLSTAGGLNTSPDPSASYEDRAFGGAGRDVLIGNTGGDRLIDWVGEFNSYVVPFAPFGTATVSRTLQPQLAEFLYALSESDGADQTLAAIDDPRNGEPDAEMGLVRQQDPVWQAQTGAPADPQAGNIPGGKRDVLRAADFNNGLLQGFAPDSGTWQVSGGALQVASNSLKSDAVAVYQVGDALPSYFEISAKIKTLKPTGGWSANSYVVFDYQSKTNFKFAGVDVSTSKLVIGQRTAAGWQVLTQGVFTSALKSDTWYNLMVYVNGLTVTLAVDNRTYLTHVFSPTVIDGYSFGLNWGLVGFGANQSRGAIDNIAVQVVPPTATVTYKEGFDSGPGGMFDGAGQGLWQTSAGRFEGSPQAGSDTAIRLADLSGVTNLAVASLLDIGTTLRTSGRAGIVFDYYGDTAFKFAAIDVASRQVLIGHRTAAGWFIDASVSQSTLNASTDYQLGVVVRGSSVSVTLNGQAVTGFVYNAVGVDGRFGLFTRGAAASFDAVTVKTNDPAVPALLEAAGSALLQQAAPQTVTQSELDALAAEAARRWRLVEDASHTTALDGLQVRMVDLPDAQLARFEDGQILLDVNAAGAGWFVDATPSGDSEFRGAGAALHAPDGGDASGRMDLLSVIAHEMGHAMGLGHSEGGLMSESLSAGTRVTPERWYAAAQALESAPMAALPAAAESAVQIDWGTLFDPGRGTAIAAVAADRTLPKTGDLNDWRQRFVNHLGQSREKLDPNAGMRVFAQPSVSASVVAKARVSSL